MDNVLVVGAGPVGLTLAVELARYGAAVRIIDAAAQRTDKSKALVVWSRTLELLARAGCADAFVAAGMQVRAANIIAAGRRIGHIPLTPEQTPYPYALMLPQSETERLLEAQLDACGVQVERRVELRTFAPAADHVAATLCHENGRIEELQAGWLAGCDGAHSTVRHGIGAQFEGHTQPSDWMLADVHLAGVPGGAPEIETYWHADGVLVLFPIAPGRYRMIADIGDAKDKARPADPTLEEVQALLDGRGPGGITASAPIWLATFRINERKVADYRAGRVFLAGDAAHVHSPAGGQGMNTGMQDACNLAWKLALVCRGLARDGVLLDSYSVERSEVGRQVLANAGRLTTMAVLRGGVAQTVRNHVAALLFGLAPVRRAMADTMSELAIGYPHSPLTRHGHATPAPGARAPIDAAHPVGAGPAPRFALFAAADQRSAAFIARHPDLLEPQPRPPFAAGGIWLVRPDDYVAVTATDGGWSELDSYLGQFAA